MYKLKDIISSGGTNPKINKAIDRYELSKDEKKDIINTIKNTQQGGGSDTSSGGSNNIYVKFLIPENNGGSEILAMCASLPMGQIVCKIPDTQTVEYIAAITVYSEIFKSEGQGFDMLETTRAFSIISTDNLYLVDKNVSIKNFNDIIDVVFYIASKVFPSFERDRIFQWLTEITKEEFYNLQ